MASLAGPFALFFVPVSVGGGSGGQVAKDALGNDVKVRALHSLKHHQLWSLGVRLLRQRASRA